MMRLPPRSTRTDTRFPDTTLFRAGGITANLEGAPIDTQFRISDEEGLTWVRRLLAEEGLCLGLSSGINVAGAIRLAKALGPGKRIATILCDTGFRYLSTRSEEQTSELQSLMRISYAVFCLKKKT